MECLFVARVKIITDSTAYLPQAYVDQYQIEVLPLSVLWEGQVYRDGVDISAGEFYRRLASAKTLPTTSQVSVEIFQEMYTRFLDEGYEVLVMPISKGISGTLFSALQAKDEMPGRPIEVVDTRLVSMALSFQVLAAARAAQAGASLAECKAVAEAAYGHIGVYFTVDTLKYLAAGGRINSAKRILGTALSVKPLLEIRDGKIELVESVITKRKAVTRMIQLIERDIAGRTPVRLSVFHAGVPEEAAELTQRVEEYFHPIENIQSEVSPVVGAHVGPGTISIAYMAG
jgi:DegV family protein with EDD domain